MSRKTWLGIAMLATGVILVPAVGIRPGMPAVAQETAEGRAELVDRVLADDMTREEMIGLYASLGSGGFAPPACVTGSEMFDDVPAASQFCAWIEELARRGITGGCTATSYCPNAPVTRSQMAVFILRATADEAPHIVGAPGEPAFGDGGEGDCLWQNPSFGSPLLVAANPVSFYKDSDGIVHLAGVPHAVPGSGGDALCDTDTDTSDAVIFQLPDGYQPEHLEVFVSGNPDIQLNWIAPQGGLTAGGAFFPGGAVFALGVDGESPTTLDGFTFRAAPAEATLSAPREPVRVSLKALRDMLHHGTHD